MTATRSAYAGKIALKLLEIMPRVIGKLRPNSTFTYEMDKEDFDVFCEHPKEIHYIYQRGIKEACQGFWYDYKYKHLEGLEKVQAISKDKMGRQSQGLEKFENIKVNLVFYPTITMRQIGPRIEKLPIVVDGRIMAVSEKNGYIKEASIFCPNGCDTDDTIHAGPTLRTYIPKCPDCRVKMNLRTSTAITDYIQTIKVQEIMKDNLSQRPISFDVKVIGDDVFNTWIGKRVRIAGHFITDIDNSGAKQVHKQFIFSKYMHEIDEIDDVCMSKERAEEIKKLLEEPENQKRLFKSFAPMIEGRLDIKESIMYALVGGSPSEVRRIDIGVLEIGNAGFGKSETIKQIPRVLAKSMYFNGIGATAAGLGIGMIKLDNQTSVPQGGPLVMCSPHGVVAIDELDKMLPEDRKALLSSMEQQCVTKIVAGVSLKLDSFVSVIAVANPKFGDWDRNHGVVENINFPTHLLTRFDIVHCSVKTNSIKKQAIAAKILRLDAITKDQALEPLLTENELLQYINYVKKKSPKLELQSKKILNDFYQQMSQITEDEDKVVPMTPRELEGLIRLTTARAKLFQKKTVGPKEIQAIIRLKKAALESFPGITLKGEGVQLKLLSELDKKEKSKEGIIYDCMDDKKTVNNVDVQKGWVEMGIYKTEQKAEWEFTKMVGSRFFIRGGRYIYK